MKRLFAVAVVALVVFGVGAGNIKKNSGWPSNVFGSSMIVDDVVPFQINKGLLIWFPLDEGAGTVAGDSSGNGHTGTLTGGPSWENGFRAGAVEFDGSTTEYISVADGDEVDISSGESFTFSVWIKQTGTSTATDRDLATKAVTSANTNYHLRVYNGRTRFLYYVGSWQVFDTTPDVWPDQTWVHIALVGTMGTGADYEFYINGVDTDSSWVAGNGNSNAPENSSIMRLGSGGYTGANGFDGRLDDFRKYDRILTSEEIAHLASGK